MPITKNGKPTTYKGKYKIKNKNKYKGDHTNIVYRSRWETLVMRYLDMHPNVVEWSSEEIIIPYVSPKDGKVHRYFPDFYVKMKKEDKIEIVLIEVKPYIQTIPPDPQKMTNKNGKLNRRYINESMTYAINTSKWDSARKYCASKGWKFLIMDEYSLGLRKKKNGN